MIRGLARGLANAVVGRRLRVVRVLSGVARGARLELDLRSQKAYWTGTYERGLQRALRDLVQPGTSSTTSARTTGSSVSAPRGSAPASSRSSPRQRMHGAFGPMYA